MKRRIADQTRRAIERLVQEQVDWMAFAARAGELVRRAVPFHRTCWHPVDPGTYLFTGSLSHNMVCSGAWLAEHEYVLEDFNKWNTLAHGDQRAQSLSAATQGNLSLSARARSSAEYGLAVGDELRVSFVVDGIFWGAAGFIRGERSPYFDADEVGLVASLSSTIALGFRSAVLMVADSVEQPRGGEPGVVVLDEKGDLEFASAAAAALIAQLAETPAPEQPHDARAVQAVAARARRLMSEPDASGPPARARARTRAGAWLELYATPLAGERRGRLAVVVQPAGPHDVAPLVARAYGLSERERQITRLCVEGRSTRDIAELLEISEYTVQDHFKSIFRKTGASSRGELVGRIFLEHYVPRFENVDDVGDGWTGEAIGNTRRKG